MSIKYIQQLKKKHICQQSDVGVHWRNSRQETKNTVRRSKGGRQFGIALIMTIYIIKLYWYLILHLHLHLHLHVVEFYKQHPESHSGVQAIPLGKHSVQTHRTCGRGSKAHYTAQRSTTPHGTAPHCTALHSTAQHSTAQHSTALHCTAQHSTAKQSTLHSTAHCSTIQCSTATRHT